MTLYPPLVLRKAVALLLPGLLACASAHAVERHELEAAIVFNFLQFVDWPAEAAPAPGGDLVLCMAPASRLSAPLRLLAGRRVRSHRFELRELAPDEPARGCHAVFVDADARVPGPALRRQLRSLPVLLIGDDQLPAAEAVTIRLGESDGRIAFDVDLAAARRSGLQISSRLLRLARKVSE